MLHRRHATPWKEDKRFLLTVGVVASVLLLSATGHDLSEQVLEFVGLISAAFMGQSQFGQSWRATKSPPVAEEQK